MEMIAKVPTRKMTLTAILFPPCVCGRPHTHEGETDFEQSGCGDYRPVASARFPDGKPIHLGTIAEGEL